MTLSINCQDGTCNQLTTNYRRNRAIRFVNKDDYEVSQLATRAVNMQNHKKNEKLAKNLNAAFNTLPLVAFASGLAMKRGVKPSLKNAAEWGLAVAIPGVINKVHNSLHSDKSKNSDLSFGVGLGLSLAGFFGASALLDRAALNPQVNKVVDAVIDGTKTTYKNVVKEIKIPDKVTKTITDLKSKIKIPESVKTACENFTKKDFMQKAITKGKELGKNAVKNAPMLLALGIIGVIFGSAIKQSVQIANTKKIIKEEQLETARMLVNSYQQEG